MALTQVQIIQSLGEAMNWLEREVSWGVALAEQKHLTGRIGELYAALITNGQMALETNQAGYDVVSSNNERISVKTTTQKVMQKSHAGHVHFNMNTWSEVDRVMLFYLNTDEMQIETLLDASAKEVELMLVKGNLSFSKLRQTRPAFSAIENHKIVAEAKYKSYTIQELESGSIIVQNKENIEPVTKPILRKIAQDVGLSTFNANGNHFNTRQLGSLLIRALVNQG